jgi:Fe-S cluster biogenesis protein NfuA
VRDRVITDPLVSTLLVVHGLHPHDVRARVERALARVSPYVSSHGGNVVLVAIEDDLVSLRLEGTCESCSSSTATATNLLERAVRDAAPEISHVKVDTGSAEKKMPPPTGLVQLGLKKQVPPPPPSRSDLPPVMAPLPSSAAAGQHETHEQCEMCGSPIGEAHDHVTRLDARELLCVCRACRLLFAHDGAARGKYRPVSERWLAGETYRLTDLEWARLGIPVRMAFFVMDSARGAPVGFYPSPGGVVEASVDDEAWTGIESAGAAFAALTPDVEAWLVDGRNKVGFDGWFVPLDACYELVARVRLHWSGFDGGDVARAKIDEFFASVRDRASTSHAGGP